ncbi:MAG: hypothetical protein EB832_04125 [Thaumarchaeota archaeon S14]|nr:MAG: hypothetical protein EB832_04125 [Thaumarchaeota archaeon S14]
MTAMRLQLREGVFLVKCTLGAKEKIELMGIIDSGSSRTYVSKKACERARLKPKGSREDVMCVHGKKHRGAPVQYYRGLVSLGTKSGSGTVYEIDVRPVVGGLHVDVVHGRDILRHFKVTLNWRDGTGMLE